MTVDVSGVLFDTIAPDASVDVSSVYFATAGPTGTGAATVDVSAVDFETKAPTAVGTVDVSSITFSTIGDTSFVDLWFCDVNGILQPILDKQAVSGPVLIE